MSGRQFLDSSNPRVRRASSLVYATATGVAVAGWFLSGGRDAIQRSDWLAATAFVITAVMAWWLVAGIGLRIVRRFDRSDLSPHDDDLASRQDR